MALPLSKPVWHLLWPLQQTQFPWRWLALLSMGLAVLTVAGLHLLDLSDRTAARLKRLAILGAMSASVVFTLAHVVREAKPLPRHDFENTLAEVPGTASVNYWFPIWASSHAKAMGAVDAGSRDVIVESWNPEHRRFSIAAGAPAEARVKTFYYPHWIAKSGDQILTTRPDKDGALLVSVPPNAVTIDLAFTEPRRSRVSAVASLAGFVFIGFLAAPLPRRPKQ
jgi:hypothetical protein